MEFWFLRHGRSLADDEKKHEGRYDSPLTEKGILQVELLANQWLEQGVCFNKIISSPLKRASKTAHIVSDILNCSVIENNFLMEMDNGILAGLDFDEARARYPEPDFLNPYQKKANGTGESMLALHARAAKVLEELTNLENGKYLVVSHGGFLNALFRIILSSPCPVNRSGVYFGFKDTGYMKTEYMPEKHIWVIREFA